MKFWTAWLSAELLVARATAWRWLGWRLLGVRDRLDALSAWLTVRGVGIVARATRLTVAARDRLERLRP